MAKYAETRKKYYEAHKEEILQRQALMKPYLEYYDKNKEKEKLRSKINYQKRMAIKRQNEIPMTFPPATDEKN